ncbi:glycosyltransferase [Flavobacteriaceae bacterium D16]|nr:glycosyltransferase [Flavobacteriaceae bacterium D16]
MNRKNILIAPLNWGLGHATRCIPIIHALLKEGFNPIIATDGAALFLLQKEFPQLDYYELPTYDIEYAKKGQLFKLKMVWDSPKILKATRREKKVIDQLVYSLDLRGIISDNRLGAYSNKVPSVFITHQLNVLAGNTTWMASRMHQRIIRKFDTCWVPDFPGQNNLSGRLGHLKNNSLPVCYLGPLSRMKKLSGPILYDLMILLSGPEPQRTLLEQHLISELKSFCGKALFVKGKMGLEQIRYREVDDQKDITYANYMTTHELEAGINASRMVLSRSGYTTIMDLAKLEKKAFFIPTPGQYEQEYLAKRLMKLGMVPCCEQNKFTLKDLIQVKGYAGLKSSDSEVDWTGLFSVFSRVKENSEPTSDTLST